jgi:uncharacterized membrane protein HdeD (DUF308 family)
MANIFVSSSRNYVLRGILTILTGGLLLFMPGLTMQTVMIMIGGMLMLSGLINLILSNRKKAGSLSGLWSFQGFSSIVIGLTFIVAPAIMVKVFAIFFGIILLIMGIMQLIGALSTRSWTGRHWMIIIPALLTITGGILLLYNPFESAEAILIFIGAILVLYGISEIFMAGKVKKRGQYVNGVQTKDIPHEEV